MAKSPDSNRLQDLAHKWLTGSITGAEKQEFNLWFSEGNEAPSEIPEVYASSEMLHKKKLWNEIQEKIKKDGKPKTVRLFWTKIAAAASIVLCVGLGFYFRSFKSGIISTKKQIAKYKDIAPGGNKAILTLANGAKISLSDATNGVLAKQSGIVISKAADGQLIYQVSAAKDGTANMPSYNTIETPKGGQYQIILPDGTRVWLNATSSLKFPTNFSTFNKREVELKGEAYFEVYKVKNQPFIVSSNRQQVEVLGTHFNINSYDDEPEIKTTLQEGTVRIHNQTSQEFILKPGQQAQLNRNGSIAIKEVDVAENLAWKNGMTRFANEDIQTIMRMISRWYNVDVVYEGKIPEVRFGGSVSRAMNISEILRVLELTDAVHFKVEGRRVTVMP